MSSVVWVYIWIGVKVYLEVGLLLSLIFLITALVNNTIDRYWLRDAVVTIFLHPVVVYYLIKELKNGR